MWENEYEGTGVYLGMPLRFSEVVHLRDEGSLDREGTNFSISEIKINKIWWLPGYQRGQK